MIMKKLVTCAALAVTAALSTTGASATTVTFTEVGGLVSGQTVTNEWAAFGLSLSGVYWYVDSRDTFDQTGIANSSAVGTVTFLSAVSSVGFDFLTITRSVTIEAYDAANTLLDTFSYSCNASFCNSSGTVSGGNIAYLQFRDSGGNVGLSTLRYSVPEPGSLALLGLGLAGLGLSRRRKA